MTLFNEAMTRLIDPTEGGDVDDPHDRGGRTSRGVTQATYDAYRQQSGAKTRDVFDMANSERLAIYHTGYWIKVHARELPTALGVFAFDAAVQHGPKVAIRLLQRAVGSPDDGYWGPNTKAAASAADQFALVRFMSARLRFYADIPGDRYDDGWMNRCAAAGDVAANLAMEAGNV